MIETIVFILFLLAILFVALGPKPPVKKENDPQARDKHPDGEDK